LSAFLAARPESVLATPPYTTDGVHVEPGVVRTVRDVLDPAFTGDIKELTETPTAALGDGLGGLATEYSIGAASLTSFEAFSGPGRPTNKV
jgi:hypothetical protein